jgi:hypothetical protein
MSDEGELQQVKGEHAHFLVVSAVGGHLAAFAKKDEVIGAVPVLDDVESFVDFTSQLKRSKIAAQEDGFCGFTELRECPVDGMLHIRTGETECCQGKMDTSSPLPCESFARGLASMS